MASYENIKTVINMEYPDEGFPVEDFIWAYETVKSRQMESPMKQIPIEDTPQWFKDNKKCIINPSYLI